MNIIEAKIIQTINKENIPDGTYDALWSGYLIEIFLSDESYLELKVDNGIRTINAPCIVKINNGEIEVEMVRQDNMNEDTIIEVCMILTENEEIHKLIEVETDYYLNSNESKQLADKIADILYDKLNEKYGE